jgi:hypothetical protein
MRIFVFDISCVCFVGSISSTIVSTPSFNDLPNLPGVRRDVSLINPKLYKQFKASQSRGSLLEEDSAGFGATNNNFEDNNSYTSFFEEASKMDLSRILTPFPQNASSYNDTNGRYSIVSQRKDRVDKKMPLPYSSTESLPAFVTNTSRVCRFLAYFTERPTENTDERSRKVEIKVFLEDNTIEINEPKIENSGVIQGKFLKRHQIFKPVTRISAGEKTLYTIADFRSGAELNFYNRIYTLIDCDQCTADYMDEMGIPFGGPMPTPDTLYDPRTRSGMSRPASRGGKAKRRAGFFDYDRKVLRFYGVWDSREMLFGDVVKVKVHYTLADDKIDIVAMSDRNSGRDPQTTLLKKSVIMKREAKPNTPASNSPSSRRSVAATSSLPNAESNGNDHYTIRPYHWRDLKIGETISVAALNVYLIDADEFTRDFYSSSHMPLGPPILLPEPALPVVTNEIPPYNGFGSEEDSLQTCKHNLIPSAPMKDGLKAQLHQGMVLRYRAVIHNPREADKSREFIIQVHLEDDTFQIREPPIRNSGHKGGIFLQRCKVDSPDQSNPAVHKTLEPKDLYIGGTVTILSHQFDILDCDQYTFKYMEANHHQWAYSDIKIINQKLIPKKEVLQRLILVTPGLANTYIDADGLAVYVEKSGVNLVKQEIFTVFRTVDASRVGTVKLSKLLRYIMDLQ